MFVGNYNHVQTGIELETQYIPDLVLKARGGKSMINNSRSIKMFLIMERHNEVFRMTEEGLFSYDAYGGNLEISLA